MTPTQPGLGQRTARARVSPELDLALVPLVPEELRGKNRLSDRVSFALREWIKEMRSKSANHSGTTQSA